MELGGGQFLNGDCLELMRDLPDGSVDMVMTSPPYDNLRTYNGMPPFTFDVFAPIADQLARVLKPGGVIVWNVADATVNGSETGSSFRQALYFKDHCGLNLHDTMIWEKPASYAFDSRQKRYKNTFEYMFVLSKGAPAKGNLIKDIPVKSAGKIATGTKGRTQDGSLRNNSPVKLSDFQARSNIWKISNAGQTGEAKKKLDHPAVYPLQIPTDHISTWTDPGDNVLDPFAGSGTTAIAAEQLGRKWICMEQDAGYYESAVGRIYDAIS